MEPCPPSCTVYVLQGSMMFSHRRRATSGSSRRLPSGHHGVMMSTPFELPKVSKEEAVAAFDDAVLKQEVPTLVYFHAKCVCGETRREVDIIPGAFVSKTRTCMRVCPALMLHSGDGRYRSLELTRFVHPRMLQDVVDLWHVLDICSTPLTCMTGELTRYNALMLCQHVYLSPVLKKGGAARVSCKVPFSTRLQRITMRGSR